MMNNNIQKEVALKSIQRVLSHKHNFIEDLENLIARTNDEYYKSKHEKMLKIVKNIFSGEDMEAPNVKLCKNRLLTLGIDFKECNNPARIPFDDGTLDLIINRHGNFNAQEINGLLHDNGVFITEQVGSENDRDLVEWVLPETEKPFPNLNLKEQLKHFKEVGRFSY